MSQNQPETLPIKVRLTLGPTLLDLEAPEDTLVRVVGKLVLEYQARGIIPPADVEKMVRQEIAKP